MSTPIGAAINAAGVSYADLARAVGVSRTVVRDWAHGTRTPSTDRLRELSVVLGVSADVLLGLVECQNCGYMHDRSRDCAVCLEESA